MKNLTNRTKVALTILCYLGLTLFINSCKDDDTPQSCGCESETRITIPESLNLIGEMYYNIPSNYPMDTYYKNYFWIVYTEKDCGNCIHHMIVCNEQFMKNQFDSIKETGEYIKVKFSGHLKKICKRNFNPADYTFERIILTSIEKQ